MLKAREFDVLETRFCMFRFFRWILILANRAKLPYSPRVLKRGMSYRHSLLPLGPPMDLMVLARARRGDAAL